MAAALPAIGGGGSAHHNRSVVLQHIPSPPKSAPAGGKTIYLAPLRRSMGKKEKALQAKKEALRIQQPVLSKLETSSYRNSYKHNLFLDMLQAGYHRSFSELFSLIKQRNEEREAAGEESVLWQQTLLENEHEKLDTLKVHLTLAEKALRKGDYDEVYDNRLKLANYFVSTKDKWLSDHFFQTCLDTGDVIHGKKRAEAYCNVGLALEESGRLYDAAEHFEQFYKLSQDGDLRLSGDENTTLLSIAATHLTRIYTAIGNKVCTSDKEAYLDYLLKAYQMAKEAGDKMIEGDSSYRLGLAYEKNGDAETSLLYLNGYLESAKQANNDEGIGKACEAIARAYSRQGKTEESITYLKMFVQVAERSKQESAYSKACSALGSAYNSQGKYEQATDYFNKAYNISRALNDQEAIATSRVFYGISMAHNMNHNVCAHVNVADKPCLERIADWKSNRTDDIGKPLPSNVKKTSDQRDQGEVKV